MSVIRTGMSDVEHDEEKDSSTEPVQPAASAADTQNKGVTLCFHFIYLFMMMMMMVKVKVKGLGTCYSAAYMSGLESRTAALYDLGTSEVAADWYELLIPWRIMRPSIARCGDTMMNELS